MLLVILYPIIYILSASVSNPLDVNSGKMWLWPVDMTFEGYMRVFDNREIGMGYLNTSVYTLIGTVIHLALLLPCAFALSRKDMHGKGIIMLFLLLTMFFSGGLIPNYLLIKELGMMNTGWAVMVPGAISIWSIVVTRTFFAMNVPQELQEAAEIDGSHLFGVFFRIALPLSGPIIAVMSLFHAVGLWNQYFSALLYLSDRSLFPLQLILREILILQEMNTSMMMSGDQLEGLAEQARIADILKYAVMIISALPLLVVYPFLQRFFVKGVLIGSLKG
ncbi:carbohydrate ABC transporter permease [Paenibacillus sp. J5C_2022]|uniref:carbohydrate ABC transporter permease n=1 Tax=Paenibacillus sp. J5C2022 TaxID=2977129 RepID=UPI0021D20974|nr:carbohydrate ABC transporter permease [Paenibacillus sp. J5C2022]MCU6709124.1 carbohydrate ABC transporter permease [Paenibacillus sp. J5C2022]